MYWESKSSDNREPAAEKPMRRTLMKRIFLSLGMLLLIAACTGYKSQETPFRPPESLANMQMAAEAKVASVAYDDPKEAEQAFGFNIRKAGLLPVQVVIDNTGTSSLTVVPGQTFLIDEQGNYWNLLDRQTAYERVEESSEYARIAGQAGKRSLLGAAGGAVVGAAVGILTGENVGEALGKGAVVGAAGGAVLGGGEELASTKAERRISQDLADKNLENRTVGPRMLGRGFLFFPGEAPSAAKLRLQLKEEKSGDVYNLVLDLTQAS
jgi:hypothetical protein